MPKTILGKLSVGLNAFFVVVIIISIALVNVLGLLSFNNHWWDITVLILAISTILAFILGVITIIKKDGSIFVYIPVILGFLAILFIFLHSLFIND